MAPAWCRAIGNRVVCVYVTKDTEQCLTVQLQVAYPAAPDMGNVPKETGVDASVAG